MILFYKIETVHGILQCRRDTDVALVSASAMEQTAGSETATFAIEHMVKVSHWEALKAALDAEWSTVLTMRSGDHAVEYRSPRKEDYWDRESKRLRRMVFEPWSQALPDSQ